jgi:hypothetical protein
VGLDEKVAVGRLGDGILHALLRELLAGLGELVLGNEGGVAEIVLQQPPRVLEGLFGSTALLY